jgi:hypothetical protein
MKDGYLDRKIVDGIKSSKLVLNMGGVPQRNNSPGP